MSDPSPPLLWKWWCQCSSFTPQGLCGLSEWYCQRTAIKSTVYVIFWWPGRQWVNILFGIIIVWRLAKLTPLIQTWSQSSGHPMLTHFHLPNLLTKTLTCIFGPLLPLQVLSPKWYKETGLLAQTQCHSWLYYYFFLVKGSEYLKMIFLCLLRHRAGFLQHLLAGHAGRSCVRVSALKVVWRFTPAELINFLLRNGFLDSDPPHRLLSKFSTVRRSGSTSSCKPQRFVLTNCWIQPVESWTKHSQPFQEPGAAPEWRKWSQAVLCKSYPEQSQEVSQLPDCKPR